MHLYCFAVYRYTIAKVTILTTFLVACIVSSPLMLHICYSCSYSTDTGLPKFEYCYILIDLNSNICKGSMCVQRGAG